MMEEKLFVCIVLFGVLLKLCAAKEPGPFVVTPLGKIEGTFKQSINGKRFHSFEGVPYAKPPVGQYRFEEAEMVEPWNHTWKANTIHKCLQYRPTSSPDMDPVIGEEDCLYLNIYTPTLDPQANLDVIFYIHGGAFMFDYAGLFGPEILLNRNIIYVSFNYRLGPLGFLSTEDNVVPGNNGLKDQILALKWVKKYIQYFGGNTNSITLAGHSAGGASVHYLYLTPATKGLFQRGMSLSGSTLNPWAIAENPLEKTKKMADAIGCPTVHIREMVDCLKSRSGRQILETVKLFQPWLYNPTTPFGVVVDRWASKPSLPDSPYNLLKRKQVHDVPWIISHTDAEGLILIPGFQNHLADLEHRWNKLLPYLLDYNYTVDPKDQDEVSQKIRWLYLGDKNVSKEAIPELTKMISDRLFVAGIEKAARMQAAATTSPVYLSYFTYRGTHSVVDFALPNQTFGASHVDDLMYVLNLRLNTYTFDSDPEISNLLLDIWTSFARTGVPAVPKTWPPLSKNVSDRLVHFKIGSPKDLVTASYDELGHGKFWDSLPINENEKLSVAKDEL